MFGMFHRQLFASGTGLLLVAPAMGSRPAGKLRTFLRSAPILRASMDR